MAVNSERENMMRRLQIASFAIDDIKLYLDTHPDDAEALEYFERYKTARNQIRQEYVSNYGPLTVETVNGAGGHWTWVDLPWPWEKEA